MSAIHKLTYGLFVLTAKEGEKDNGCIINTAIQAANGPLISICVNKANLTHDMIKATGQFNISVLTQEAPFEIFQHYGMQAGREVEKIVGEPPRMANGIAYVEGCTNAVISVKVTQEVDLGSHTEFVGEVVEEKVLSDVPSCTYQYYFDNIKPAPGPKKTGWVCTICGYVYEGDPLPEDFVCPVCKHGAEDFVRLQ
ncbi:flavin reductase [Eubacterium sp. AB3007]|uniref:flavin reductase n=1 Tax=Eubacterium sp. AB3007 TaxID=1392487 RepID=UPI000AAF1D8C